MVLSMDGYPPGAAVGGRRIPAGAPPSQCGKRNVDLSAGSVAECGIEGSALVSGWLFDLYPAKGGMVLWVVDEAGGSHRLTEAFEPVFFAAVGRRDLAGLGRALGAGGAGGPGPPPGVGAGPADRRPGLRPGRSRGAAPPPAPYRRLHRGHLLRLRPAAGPAVQPPPQGLPP